VIDDAEDTEIISNSRPFFVGISGAERRLTNSFSVKSLAFYPTTDYSIANQ